MSEKTNKQAMGTSRLISNPNILPTHTHTHRRVHIHTHNVTDFHSIDSLKTQWIRISIDINIDFTYFSDEIVIYCMKLLYTV